MLENGAQILGLAGGFGARASVNIWDHWTKIDSAAEQFAFANNFDVARSKPFQLIGHSLLALLFAYIGGLIARRFARGDESKRMNVSLSCALSEKPKLQLLHVSLLFNCFLNKCLHGLQLDRLVESRVGCAGA